MVMLYIDGDVLTNHTAAATHTYTSHMKGFPPRDHAKNN